MATHTWMNVRIVEELANFDTGMRSIAYTIFRDINLGWKVTR